MVGVDFFESQGTTDGDSYARLRERIETAVERGCGKPVIVASIGAPSGPAELGWTEPYQAQYLAGAFDAAVDAGAVGFFYFEPKTGDSHGVEITEFDLTVMDKAREVLNGGWTQTVEEFQVSVEGFILWALEQFGDDFDAGVEYFTGHFFQVLETAEAYWGLVHGDGSPKPGFSCLSCRYHGQDCAAAGCAY
jgi:hypothetical protein